MGNRGFSLIELMIAVGIVGTLASVAGPAYIRYANRAKSAEAPPFRCQAYRTEYSVLFKASQ